MDEFDEVEKEVILVKEDGRKCVVGILTVFFRLVLARFSNNEDDIFYSAQLRKFFYLYFVIL